MATIHGEVRNLAMSSCRLVELTDIETVPTLGELARTAFLSNDPDLLCIFELDNDSLATPGDWGAIERLKNRATIALIPPDLSEVVWRRLRFAGVSGLVTTEIADVHLARTIKLIESGLRVILTQSSMSDRIVNGIERLSDRELQVLQGICDGLQNKEIAHGFAIKEVTVKMHVRAIIRKLGAKNRTHAAMIARDFGLSA